jgi:hypothetical protein
MVALSESDAALTLAIADVLSQSVDNQPVVADTTADNWTRAGGIAHPSLDDSPVCLVLGRVDELVLWCLRTVAGDCSRIKPWETSPGCGFGTEIVGGSDKALLQVGTSVVDRFSQSVCRFVGLVALQHLR